MLRGMMFWHGAKGSGANLTGWNLTAEQGSMVDGIQGAKTDNLGDEDAA